MLTIGNVKNIETRLVNVENQIRQFKDTQNYGMRQIQYFDSNAVSVNAETWYYSAMQMNIYGSHPVVEFVGIYPSKMAVGEAIVTITNYSGSEFDLYWAANLLPTNESNVLQFEVWSQHLHPGVPFDPDDPSYSTGFTLNIKVRANMTGVLSLVSSEVPQGLIDVFDY